MEIGPYMRWWREVYIVERRLARRRRQRKYVLGICRRAWRGHGRVKKRRLFLVRRARTQGAQQLDCARHQEREHIGAKRTGGLQAFYWDGREVEAVVVVLRGRTRALL